MSYRSKKVQQWRNKTKLKLIEAMGNKCARCNYDKCKYVLHFHHINSNGKDDTIANFLRNPRKIQIIIEEAKKCVLLCANCHGELHASLWNLNEINIPQIDDSIDFNMVPEKKEHICQQCGKPTFNRFYCSYQCAGKSNKKIDWPDVNTLKQMVINNSYVKVGDLLGVSDNAVRKHLAKYG
jgi:hypothetical protein